MKRLFCITTLVAFAFVCSYAQAKPQQMPGMKQHLDSVFRKFSQKNQPFVMRVPETYSFPENGLSENKTLFEKINPGAVVINQTKKGTVYNMPLDNMAVLVPNMNTVEKMPVSTYSSTVRPENMPNSLQPGNLSKKK